MIKVKNLWRLYPIFIILGIIIFFQIKWNLEYKKFHQTAINSLIIKKKNNWSGGRSYDYLTKNNIVITLISNNLLKVGDSISKESNTDEFEIYIKIDKGKYQFYKKIDLNDD